MRALVLLLLVGAVVAAALIWDIRQWRSTTADALLAYNRGVSQHRRGDYPAALDDFRAACAAQDRRTRQAALYNLGTTHLQLALERSSLRPAGASDHLTAAVQTLDEALALDPADADAAQNLALARAQLVSINEDAMRKPATSQASATPDSAAVKADAGRQLPAGPPAGTAGPGVATALVGEGVRRRAEALPRDQALRLLDEGRGREVLRSATAVAGKGGILPAPEKDW